MSVTFLHSPTRPKLQSTATPINPDALYSVKQCQAWAGICNTTWYRLGRFNKLPPVRKLGRRTMVAGRDFMAWRDSLATTSASTSDNH